MDEKAEKGEILHIFVIGFHHKKGCQIEFSYPPIECLPDEWKNLPSLAMPDGAHNYENDAVYFHLPSLNGDDSTIFGISCFQQIPIEKVKKRTIDMTRGTIQKAICILSTLPLFGYIQIKMELVTAAFFDEGDFDNVSLLKDAFHHLNDCLNNSYSQHLHDGLSACDLVLKFRHRTLLLFKLLLLERKVIFFNSPVKPLCCTLLSLISLHPGQIGKGLLHSFSSSRLNSSSITSSEKTIIHERVESQISTELGLTPECDSKPKEKVDDDICKLVEECIVNHDGGDACTNEATCKSVRKEESITQMRSDHVEEDSVTDCLIEDYFAEIKAIEALEVECGPVTVTNSNHDINYIKDLNLESMGLPLSIFTEGNYCLPYVSISYLDFLMSPEVRGFHGGATNLLFKQKKQLMDVLVELENSKIETNCPELRRQLFLTTEDLRFGERLIRAVTDPSTCPSSCSIEEWIRMQFTLYMLSMLRTSLMEDGSKELDHFNIYFINAWKDTNNYKIWMSQDHKTIMDFNPGHPYAGNLSVADVRLRFSQAMTNTESGRRLNQAVTSTGKAVGGAITQARGAISHWWSTLTTPELKSPKAVNNI